MDTISPLEFLHYLYGDINQGAVQLTYKLAEFQEYKKFIHSECVPLPYDFRTSDPDMPRIRKWNEDGYGVHFCVPVRPRVINGKDRGTEDDTLLITALWADVEVGNRMGVECNGDMGLMFNRLRGVSPWPSVITFSGGGFHAYWRLIEPVMIDAISLPMIKQTLRGIARTLGTDEQVADLARMMRLPGTVNTKPERNGAECYIADDWSGALPEYHYAELEALFAAKGANRPKHHISRAIPLGEKRIPKWVEQYIAIGAVEGDRNKALFRNACALFEAGFELYEVESLLRSRAESDGQGRTFLSHIRSAARRAGVPNGDFKVPSHLRHMMSGEDSL